MESVDELRKAAEKLRALASASDVTPGPWYCDRPQEVSDSCQSAHPVAETWEEPDAPYIATMHPGVGLALAYVLDEMGRRVDDLNDASSRPLSEETLDMNLATYSETLTLARLINGGAA